MTQGFSTRLFQFASTFPPLGIPGGTQHLTCAGQRERIGLAGPAEPPSLSQPQRWLLIHAGPAVHIPWSRSAPSQSPRPITVSQVILPHTRGLAAGPSEQRNKQQLPPAWSHPGASRGHAQPAHPAPAHCVSTLLCSKTTEAQHEPHNTLLPKASHESFLTFLTKKNNGE